MSQTVPSTQSSEPGTEAEIPEVTFVVPFRPSAQSAHAERLEYPALEAAVEKHLPFKEARAERFASLAPGTLAYEQAELELKKQDLLECAWELQRLSTPQDQELWSKKFTAASAAIYGSPDRDVALRLASTQLSDLSRLTARADVDQARLQRVLAFYREYIDGIDAVAGLDDSPMHTPSDDVLTGTKQYFEQRFGHVLAAITDGDSADRVVDSQEIVQRFERALSLLKADDPAWNGWQAVLQDSGSISVRCAQQCVLVGTRRAPMRLGDLPAVFAHEVLVHALRQIHANALGDEQLTKGLPGYADAEEGLAVFVGYALSGMSPEKGMYKYVDIALALGLFGRKPVPRQRLFAIALDRFLVLQTADGLPADLASATDSVWEYVNRIYRGTRGQDAVGVFTKDVCYYRGFRKIADYLQAEMPKRPLADIFDYLLACKFDPFDVTQSLYVTKALASAPGEGAVA